MPYKPREKSTELLILSSLNNRMNLLDKDKQHFLNLKKGYEGELMLDSFTEMLQCECLILNDLLLKLNSTTFQIDTLIITSHTIYLLEVKNYEGDYYFESDRFYKKPNSEISNPLLQLNRSESLLRQLLHNLGVNIPIEASLIFINPEFTLYQSPLNLPVIFPTQINRFFKKLNSTSSKINGKQQLLADKLISLHMEDSPFKQVLSYDYDQLRKGIICSNCQSFSISVIGKKCVCKDCGHEEPVAYAVIRCVKEFKLLFPSEKITTNTIHEWCQVVESKKCIRKILEKNYKIVGVHRWAYFE